MKRASKNMPGARQSRRQWPEANFTLQTRGRKPLSFVKIFLIVFSTLVFSAAFGFFYAKTGAYDTNLLPLAANADELAFSDPRVAVNADELDLSDPRVLEALAIRSAGAGFIEFEGRFFKLYHPMLDAPILAKSISTYGSDLMAEPKMSPQNKFLLTARRTRAN